MDFRSRWLAPALATAGLIAACGPGYQLPSQGKAPKAPIWIFVFSEASGNFSGQPAADVSCTSVRPANLPCSTVHAFISSTSVPISVFTSTYSMPSDRPFYVAGHNIQVAPDLNTFINGPLTNSLTGAGLVSAQDPWTGATITGGASVDCTDWTSTGSTPTAASMTIVAPGWLANGSAVPCTGPSTILCVCW